MSFIIQLIFLQPYFPIPVPGNITRYYVGVITRALGLHNIPATTVCFNSGYSLLTFQIIRITVEGACALFRVVCGLRCG